MDGPYRWGGDRRARGLVVSAVVDELRETLNTADLDAQLVTRGATLDDTVVVLDLPLRDAALLTQLLRAAPHG